MSAAPPLLVRATVILLLLLLMGGVLTVSWPGWAPAGVLDSAVILAGAIWAAFYVYRPFPLRRSALLLPLGGAVVWAVGQLVFGISVYPFETRRAALGWLAAFLLFALALQVFDRADVRDWFRRRLMYFGFLLSVVSTLQLFTSRGKIFWIFPTAHPGPVLGPFVNRDHYSALILMLFPLAMYEALKHPRRSWTYGAMAAAMFASVIAGASRAGSILVTAELAFFLIRWGAHSLPALSRVAALTGVLAAVVGWQVLWVRFQEPDPFRYRREMTASALAMARERAWTGFGLGAFETVYPGYALFDIGLRVDHAHNDWAEWAAEGGLPFVLLLAGVAAWSLRQGWRAPWGIGAGVVFLHSLVDYPMQVPPLLAWACVILGAMAARKNAGDPGGHRS